MREGAACLQPALLASWRGRCRSATAHAPRRPEGVEGAPQPYVTLRRPVARPGRLSDNNRRHRADSRILAGRCCAVDALPHTSYEVHGKLPALREQHHSLHSLPTFFLLRSPLLCLLSFLLLAYLLRSLCSPTPSARLPPEPARALVVESPFILSPPVLMFTHLYINLP